MVGQNQLDRSRLSGPEAGEGATGNGMVDASVSDRGGSLGKRTGGPVPVPESAMQLDHQVAGGVTRAHGP